jgi:cytochrome c peroxidase
MGKGNAARRFAETFLLNRKYSSVEISGKLKGMKTGYFLLLGILVWACAAHSGGEVTPETPTPTDPPLFYVPKNFPQPLYPTGKNPITPEGFTLGKTLFYDGVLSRDSTIACGECHRQNYGFTHHLHDLSHGINGRTGLRNAQPLHNLAWEDSFLWDGAVTDLDQQPLTPIQHPDEMDDTMDNVLKKLRRRPAYPAMYKAAFGTEEITQERTLQALSQFLRALVSANSKYDKYVRKEAGGTLTPDELAGLQLFKDKGCANCHAGELFTDHSFRNNGLSLFERTKVEYVNEKPTLIQVIDEGRARVTGKAEDRYRFKVPSLRNVANTLPYMHDGRFQTLAQVLDHYASGVQDTPNLDPLLKQNGRLGIPLTDDEKKKLLAFLNTLSDTQYLNDPRFAEPPGFPVR